VLTLPQIDQVERTPDGLRLHFVIPPALPYFDGHFPEVPLLPGVVQIGWAVELARVHLGQSSGGSMERFRELAAVKFMRVMQPGASVWLTLGLDRASREIAFEYRAGEHACSSGRIRFH
jgi:3-hydroxymyristoyl/3-hydroxydecanoyl-(acyl carrier protein) dehydratase